MTVNSEFQYVQAAAVISRCDESAMLLGRLLDEPAREVLLEVDDAEPVQRVPSSRCGRPGSGRPYS